MNGQWKPGQPLTAEDRAILAPLLARARELGRSPKVGEVPHLEIRADGGGSAGDERPGAGAGQGKREAGKPIGRVRGRTRARPAA